MKKVLKLLLTLVMISALLLACGKQTIGNESSQDEKIEENSKEDKITEEQPSGQKENTEEESSGQGKNNEELVSEDQTEEVKKILLTIYSSNENANGLVESQVEIEELRENLILEQLIKAGVLTEGTKINHLEKKIEDNKIYLKVDFNEKLSDLLYSCGTSGELMKMGSIVNTFLNAYEAERFLFTVNGQIFESGHVIYDEPLSIFNFEN